MHAHGHGLPISANQSTSPHPPPISLPQYSSSVPSLAAFCIAALAEYPLDIHQLGLRLHYRPPLHSHQLAEDPLHSLCPSHAVVDPRLWATIVQIYDNLPPEFSSFIISLGDVHLPLLQQIPSTPHFSLITILELPGCYHLTDDSISNLKHLHTLTAFDATGTNISSLAISSLVNTCLWTDPVHGDQARRRGPWSLRVLCLKDCSRVNNAVLPYLSAFPLLSVVDLRGTNVTLDRLPPFFSSEDASLFHPTPIANVLQTLFNRSPSLYSSPAPFSFHIKTLHDARQLRALKASKAAPVSSQDGYVVFSRSGRVFRGDSHTAELKRQVLEERDAHERNKALWYENHEKTEGELNFMSPRPKSHQSLRTMPPPPAVVARAHQRNFNFKIPQRTSDYVLRTNATTTPRNLQHRLSMPTLNVSEIGSAQTILDRPPSSENSSTIPPQLPPQVRSTSPSFRDLPPTRRRRSTGLLGISSSAWAGDSPGSQAARHTRLRHENPPQPHAAARLTSTPLIEPPISQRAHIASEEHALWTALPQGAGSFYATPISDISSPSLPRRPSSQKKSDVCNLKLYRDPPPWSSLPSTPLKNIQVSRPITEHAHVVKTNNKKARLWQQAKETLSAFNISQTQKQNLFPAPTRLPTPSSRNPFKRTPSGRSLKEISELPIPSLPSVHVNRQERVEEKIKTKEEGKKKSNGAQKGFDWGTWSKRV